MDIYDIKQSIQDDIDAGLDISVINEGTDFITIIDSTESSREYTLTNPESITPNWIECKIIETPSASELPYRINIYDLANYIHTHIDSLFLSSLSQIIIIGDNDEDYQYLRNLSYELMRALEESELPYDELGMNWWSSSKIIIHMGNIVNLVNDMFNNLEIDEWDILPEINYAVLTTTLHEIRHLAQSNPYIPQEILCQCSDDEIDAEEYARQLVEQIPPIIVQENQN